MKCNINLLEIAEKIMKFIFIIVPFWILWYIFFHIYVFFVLLFLTPDLNCYISWKIEEIHIYKWENKYAKYIYKDEVYEWIAKFFSDIYVENKYIEADFDYLNKKWDKINHLIAWEFYWLDLDNWPIQSKIFDKNLNVYNCWIF